jgi:hypothetical protein
MNSHIVNCLEPQQGSLRKPQSARAFLVGLGRSPVIFTHRVAEVRILRINGAFEIRGIE